jgi:hypothetical protein
MRRLLLIEAAIRLQAVPTAFPEWSLLHGPAANGETAGPHCGRKEFSNTLQVAKQIVCR